MEFKVKVMESHGKLCLLNGAVGEVMEKRS